MGGFGLEIFHLTLYQESLRLLPSSVIQHIVIIMALTSHSQVQKPRYSKGQSSWGHHTSFEGSSHESHRTCSAAPAVNGDNMWGNAANQEDPQGFSTQGSPGWLKIMLGRLGQAPTKIPSSQRQVLGTSHIVCKNSLAQWVITISGKAGSKIQVPRCQPRFNYVGRRPF